MEEQNIDIKDKWNARHAAASSDDDPVILLTDYAHLLPWQGNALDLACGRGRNSLFLAQHGLSVDAWDISDVAIEQLSRRAEQAALPINAQVRDVLAQPIPIARYDVIVVSYFLERSLVQPIMSALKPGGLLFYQTFIQAAVDDSGPGNPAFRLASNELLQMFASLHLVLYREEGLLGDCSKGLRNVAQLIGQKQ